MDKQRLIKQILMKLTPEEMEAYNEPSIMDPYIKEHDPEQWDKIEHARMVQSALNMSTGMIGSVGRFGKLGKVLRSAEQGQGGGSGKIPTYNQSLYKPLEDVKSDLPRQIHEKAFQTLTPETQDFGKAISKELPKEQIGKVTHIVDEQPLTLMERVNKMENTLDTVERLARLREYLKQKKAQKLE